MVKYMAVVDFEKKSWLVKIVLFNVCSCISQLCEEEHTELIFGIKQHSSRICTAARPP